MIWLYVLIGISLFIVVYFSFLIIKAVNKRKADKKFEEVKKQKMKDNLNVVDDVRYTMEENPINKNENSEPEVNITFLDKDIVLKQNTPYEVSVQKTIKPGKYLILSTNESVKSFNIRVGIFIREYKHNQEIVLAEGDTICAVSSSVILR